MRRLILSVALAAVLLPPAAEAQPRQPSRDYAATYRMESEGKAAEIRVFYSAASRRQRVETAEGGMAMIHDIPGNRMLMLNAQNRMAMELPGNVGPGQQNMLNVPDDMTLTRTGTATVAGHRCTTYRAMQAGVERGTVCVTDDGILLRADFQQGERRGTMQATALSLDSQPASLFQVPEGWQVTQMPQGQGQRRPQR
jgi:hypothetical protein